MAIIIKYWTMYMIVSFIICKEYRIFAMKRQSEAKILRNLTNKSNLIF